jgi:hypothetical protein
MRNVILTAAGILFPHLCAFASALPQTPAASSVPASSTVTDVPSLSQELARISKLLDNKPSPTLLTDLRNSLPNQWTINTPERTYSVPTDYLRSQLAAGSAENAKAWSDFLAAKLRGYAAEGPASPASSRAELDRILAGFSLVRSLPRFTRLRLGTFSGSGSTHGSSVSLRGFFVDSAATPSAARLFSG